jgi:hypothetical protein
MTKPKVEPLPEVEEAMATIGHFINENEWVVSERWCAQTKAALAVLRAALAKGVEVKK